ncbi:MAG: hypothetical protein ACXADO_04695 [Candidatus Thorarchaeota archaeon]
MTPQSSSSRHRIVAVLILVVGPILAALLWPLASTVENAWFEGYVIASACLVILFAVWAWKKYPPFPYIAGV